MRLHILALTLVGFAAPAFSQIIPPPFPPLFPPEHKLSKVTTGSIINIRTGLNADSFEVLLQGTIENPANCPRPDGYLSDSSQPGYNTYYAAALTAYSVNRPVDVYIDLTECLATRPKLIGIALTR